MKLDCLDYDFRKIEDGVWVKDPLFPEVEYLVVSLRSERFELARARYHKPLNDAYKAKDEAVGKAQRDQCKAVIEELNARLFADGLLAGWKGIEGVSDEYNEEDALKICSKLRVREIIDKCANDVAAYLQEEERGLGEA